MGAGEADEADGDTGDDAAGDDPPETLASLGPGQVGEGPENDVGQQGDDGADRVDRAQKAGVIAGADLVQDPGQDDGVQGHPGDGAGDGGEGEADAEADQLPSAGNMAGCVRHGIAHIVQSRFKVQRLPLLNGGDGDGRGRGCGRCVDGPYIRVLQAFRGGGLGPGNRLCQTLDGDLLLFAQGVFVVRPVIDPRPGETIAATRRNGDLLGIPFDQLIGIIIGRHKFLPFLVEEAGGRAQPASSSIDYSF